MPKFLVLFVLNAYFLGCLYTMHYIKESVDEPYMDEIFHLPQTQAYCRNEFGKWDPKITTFPGLYLFGLAWSKIGSCELKWLRQMHLIFLLATPFLMFKMLRTHMLWKPALATAVLLALWPVHFFYHFLYYTDPPSTFWVLLMCHLTFPTPLGQAPSSFAPAPPSRLRVGLASMAGSIAILCRQNNVVWVLFALGTSILAFLQQTKEFRDLSLRTLSVGQIKAFVSAMFRNYKQLLLNFWPLLLPVIAFVVFLKWNGSIVLGDKSNHVAVFHFAQLGYFFALYASLWGVWHYDSALAKDSIRNMLKTCFSSIWKTLLSMGTVFIVGILLHFYTLDHPFLRSDNRHYTFYVWNRYLGNSNLPWLKSAMALPYSYSAFFCFKKLGERRSALWILIFLIATFLVLVPAHLLEPRYFTIPLFIALLNSPQLSSPSLVMGIATAALVNLISFYIFISKPFVWNDESRARFSW